MGRVVGFFFLLFSFFSSWIFSKSGLTLLKSFQPQLQIQQTDWSGMTEPKQKSWRP